MPTPETADFPVSSMDWVRATLLNAQLESFDLNDPIAMAAEAQTPQIFDLAVNEWAGPSTWVGKGQHGRQRSVRAVAGPAS